MDQEPRNPIGRFCRFLYILIDTPVVYFRGNTFFNFFFVLLSNRNIHYCIHWTCILTSTSQSKTPFLRLSRTWTALSKRLIFLFSLEKIVEPNRPSYAWYHQKFQRVPGIETCQLDDYVCRFEANVQFLRDKLVFMSWTNSNFICY